MLNKREEVIILARYLTNFQLKLGVAESCTGGLLAHSLTNLSGSSNWFVGGIVAYSNQVKENLLGVSKKTLEEFGAVSRECVLEMVKGVARLLEVEVAIAISGIAGPTGGTPLKPVGTVYQAYLVQNKIWAKRYFFVGNRWEIKEKSVHAAIKEIISFWEVK